MSVPSADALAAGAASSFPASEAASLAGSLAGSEAAGAVVVFPPHAVSDRTIAADNNTAPSLFITISSYFEI